VSLRKYILIAMRLVSLVLLAAIGSACQSSNSEPIDLASHLTRPNGESYRKLGHWQMDQLVALMARDTASLDGAVRGS
jgi:hypothetical protein